MTKVLHIVIAGVLLAVGCETPAPPDHPIDPADTITHPRADDPDLLTCTNPEGGYTLNYPSVWQTNPGDVMSPCSLFDPEPIDVRPATEIPADIAIRILLEPARFDDITQEFFGQRVLQEEPEQTDGRQALRVELEHTEDLLYPAGTLSYNYYVDLGDRTLVASTYDIGEPAYDETRRVLDLMMATMRFEGN